MFYLSDDKKIVKDCFGDIVGYVLYGKFTQTIRDGNNIKKDCDSPYSNGLSPLQLEQISELLQRKK
jgi:hypothetical protein